MSTTEPGSDVPQPAEAQPAERQDTPPESPPARTRSDRALAWTQLGFGVVCVGTGTVIGLSGHPDLGTAIVGGGGLSLTVRIERR